MGFDPDDLRRLGWPGEVFPVGGWGGAPSPGYPDVVLAGLRAEPAALDRAVGAAHEVITQASSWP